MKVKTIYLTLIILILLLVIDQQVRVAVPNGSGAPAGHTGSPFDNKTCAKSGCHGGNATAIAGIITSNVPPGGYVPGTIYTISCSCSQTGINKWGFQVSPMNSSGTLQGSIIITSPATTKIVASKYITHTSSGTSGAGAKTWSFNWLAPISGTGSVTFYGAFNFANNNNMSSGDVIHTSTLTISENSVGVFEMLNNNSILASCYPNPVTENVTLKYQITERKNVNIYVTTLKGVVLECISKNYLMPGNYMEEINMNEYSPGIYMIKMMAGNEETTKKIVKL